MDKDLHFFEMAKEYFTVTKLFSERHTPMFEGNLVGPDAGPEEIRATVHMYTMKRKKIH